MDDRELIRSAIRAYEQYRRGRGLDEKGNLWRERIARHFNQPQSTVTEVEDWRSEWERVHE